METMKKREETKLKWAKFVGRSAHTWSFAVGNKLKRIPFALKLQLQTPRDLNTHLPRSLCLYIPICIWLQICIKTSIILVGRSIDAPAVRADHSCSILLGQVGASERLSRPAGRVVRRRRSLLASF